MRIISDILNKEFDSVEACLAAEAAFEAREDEKASKIAELSEALKAYEEAEEHYLTLLAEFDKLYCSDEDNDNDEYLLEEEDDEYACECKSPDCTCDKEVEATDSLMSAIGKLLGGVEQKPKAKIKHPTVKTRDNSEIAVSIEDLLDAIFG